MANTYLERTVGTPDTNGNKKGTFSAWIKRCKIGTEQAMYVTRTSGTQFVRFRFDSDKINVTSNTSGTNYYATTDAVYRDCNGWYHVVVAYDTTQATAANRIRIYVNGVEQSKSASNYPSQDATIYLLASGQPQRVGAQSSDLYFDGLMSHVHYTEGYAYAASDFGSTDSDTGEWKINTSPSVSYGTNGFFWLKDDITTTDHSPNSNTFTANGTLTKTLDCPSNVFCTLNALGNASSNFTLIQGNTYSGGADNNWRSIYGTLGASSGKFYYEVKCISSSDYERFGWCTVDQMNLYQDSSGRYDDNDLDEGYGYTSDGEKSNNGGTTGGYGATWSAGDILSCAIDLDNQKIYWGKSGTWQNGGDPTSGSTGTGSAYNIEPNKIYVPAFASYGAASNLGFNFGNGYFRTTAITTNSGNGYSGAEGKSKFEYQPPTGYSALCTRGLNE